MTKEPDLRGSYGWSAVVAALLLLGVSGATTFADSQIRRDEVVTFFPTAAYLDESTGEWVIPVHARIFEPETNSLTRRAALFALRRRLNLDPEADSTRLFKERMAGFIADNEGGKPVQITIGDQEFNLIPSDTNGQIRDTVRVSQELVDRVAADGWLTVSAVTPVNDEREFLGKVQLVPPQGLSVISDIDDTLKVSNVTDRSELIRRTLLTEFEAVDGMAAFCKSLREQGADFHYVSSSPWQLYPALSEFFEKSEYPQASWHLRDIAFDDLSLLNLFSDPFEDKLARIEAILERYPRRQFILIGDSGERDPDVYGEIARKHPEQIAGILIRLVTDEPADGERFAEAFRDVPPEHWTVFRNPAELAIE